MRQKSRREARAIIEDVWRLGEAWQRSEFPLSEVLARLYELDRQSSEASMLFCAFHRRFIREYGSDAINVLSLKPGICVHTTIKCPGANGLERLRDFETPHFRTDCATYRFNWCSWLKPHRMLLEMYTGRVGDDVMVDMSVESIPDKSYPKLDNDYMTFTNTYMYARHKRGIGCSRGHAYYTTVRQELREHSRSAVDNCVLIRKLADLLFFAPKLSAHLDASSMGETGPVYSAYMSMAHDIMAEGVNNNSAMSESELVADRYRKAIDSVMEVAEQTLSSRIALEPLEAGHRSTEIEKLERMMLREARGIQAIPRGTFNVFFGESTQGPTTPLYRSNVGGVDLSVRRDYSLNRHRPKIFLWNEHNDSMHFMAEEDRRFSAFYSTLSDTALPFHSSVRWNYLSSNFLFASADLAAELMKRLDSTNDFDDLRETIQSATRFVQDLSQFERSFARFFAPELLMYQA